MTATQPTTARVINITSGAGLYGNPIVEGWNSGPTAEAGRRWDPAELGPVIKDLLTRVRPAATMAP